MTEKERLEKESGINWAWGFFTTIALIIAVAFAIHYGVDRNHYAEMYDDTRDALKTIEWEQRVHVCTVTEKEVVTSGSEYMQEALHELEKSTVRINIGSDEFVVIGGTDFQSFVSTIKGGDGNLSTYGWLINVN